MQLGTLGDLARYDPESGQTTIVNHLTYDAFGRVTGQTNPAVATLFAFTGRPLDPATGLQNHLHRWYDPAIGRWLSEDPLGFAAADANLYRYSFNTPTNVSDPSGTTIAVEWHPAPPPSWWPSWLYWPYDKPPTFDPSDLIAPIGMAKVPISAARGAWAARAARAAAFVERHHLLPREFADNFAKVGLDIEKFVIKLPQDAHRLKPGGLHTGKANWNGMWAQFFREHPNYTRQDVLDQLDKMKKLFGVE